MTANLAQALRLIQKNVLVVDADPANVLRLHLGMPLSEKQGWAPLVCTGENWQSAGFESPSGVAFLPFGQLQQPLQQQMNTCRIQSLSELAASLCRIEFPAHAEHWQLFHFAPSDLHELSSLAQTHQFDLVLVVMTPEASAYSLLSQTSDALAESGSSQQRWPRIRYVLNQYQPETEISRDFTLVLKEELGTQLSSVVLHRDTALLDSVANLTTVQQFSPSSQAARDYQSLALWCVSQLAAEASER
ncbi:cellulose biosynthesis protein BcsQ [Photobacterium sp. GJ3]|uniref:cellulose biosynthesis protein BcsQ n=1 Tax=Photobacterium sp. GJ3 TaxID=2829502 RepID=UPI0020118DC4|nr:cellulose biosynthesis protein BcsQ [Photobacterium sp. GJ3]